MALKPTGHRILIKPDEQRTETDAGLVLLESSHYIPVSGTVVAVGTGPQWAAALKRDILKDVREIVEGTGEIFPNDGGAPFDVLRDELGRYAQRISAESELHVGDRVMFPVEAGQQVTEDGEVFILMNEDDVLGIVQEEQEETAA